MSLEAIRNAVGSSVPSVANTLYLGAAVYGGRNFVVAGYNKAMGIVTGNDEYTKASRNALSKAITDLPRDLVKAATLAGLTFGGQQAYNYINKEEEKGYLDTYFWPVVDTVKDNALYIGGGAAILGLDKGVAIYRNYGAKPKNTVNTITWNVLSGAGNLLSAGAQKVGNFVSCGKFCKTGVDKDLGKAANDLGKAAQDVADNT